MNSQASTKIINALIFYLLLRLLEINVCFTSVICFYSKPLIFNFQIYFVEYANV